MEKINPPAPAERMIKLVSPYLSQKKKNTKLAILSHSLKLDIAQYFAK